MAKAKKARASKYDEKLAIVGTFDELVKVTVSPITPKKAAPKKPAKNAVKKKK
jgi:hypothetical protein